MVRKRAAMWQITGYSDETEYNISIFFAKILPKMRPYQSDLLMPMPATEYYAILISTVLYFLFQNEQGFCDLSHILSKLSW